MIFTLFGAGLVLTGFLFISNQDSTPRLDEEKVAEKKVDDFILHMKVERATSGVEVHHSLQYIGEQTIEVQHQTPLVSFSLHEKNHDFTGSLVSKMMRTGNIYYQESVTVPISETGESNLYVKARFLANGELVNIEHVEELMFN